MFDTQCWWITGASSGIGAALAAALAERGARLILSGRNKASLGEVAVRCGADRCMVLPFEATDYDAIPGLVAKAWAWAGRIDGLVNNAGISQRSLALETEFSVYERIVAVDLLAPIALTRAILPQMVAAGGGHLVAITSVAGIAGAPMRSAYSAAKFGLGGFHESVRCETAHLGMKVLVVAPGSVKTNVSRNALLADGSARGASDAAIEAGMDPSEAAARIVDAIADGARELTIAGGIEAEMVRLAREDRERLFDLAAGFVARGYADQMKSNAPD